MKLADYYRPDNARTALDRYAEKYTKAWPISEKVRLDAAAQIAFASEFPARLRRDGFLLIHETLRGRWQVFRGAGTRWNAERIHDALIAQAEVLGPGGGWALSRLAAQADLTPLLRCVEAVFPLKMKKNGCGSAMAASKFLHFMNPALFPVYDLTVVENRVLYQFRREWLPFSPALPAQGVMLNTGVLYYLKYMLFAAAMIRPHRDEVMRIFEEWVGEQLAREGKPLPAGEGRGAPEARAFEFIAIGAAACEE